MACLRTESQTTRRCETLHRQRLSGHRAGTGGGGRTGRVLVVHRAATEPRHRLTAGRRQPSVDRRNVSGGVHLLRRRLPPESRERGFQRWAFHRHGQDPAEGCGRGRSLEPWPLGAALDRAHAPLRSGSPSAARQRLLERRVLSATSPLSRSDLSEGLIGRRLAEVPHVATALRVVDTVPKRPGLGRPSTGGRSYPGQH